MKNKIIVALAIVLSAYILNGCDSGPSGENSLPTDSTTIASGLHSFNEKCASCHNFYYEGIGPQLAGITSQNSVEWIRNFIRDPKAMIDSGDTTAKKLFDQ